MQVSVTVNSEDLLRIEDDDEAAITIRKQGNKAQLLSIFVPKYDREEGIGSELLAACEKIVFSMGMQRMVAYYPDSIEGMTEFLENAGYSVSTGAPAISIEFSGMLSSISVKKLLATDTGSALFVPFSQLISTGGEDLLKVISKFKINIKNSDVSRLHKEISGVVYDDNEDPKAFILCSKEGESLVVELFAGIGESNSIYVTVAIVGLIRGIIEDGGEEKYKYLSMIVANEKIEACINRYFRKGKTRKSIANIMSASKGLTDEELPDTDIDEDIDEDKDEIWEREVRKVPFMANAIFKMSWLDSVSSTDGFQEYLEVALGDLYDEDIFFRDSITLREFSRLSFVNARPSDNVYSIDEVDRNRYKEALFDCELIWVQERTEHFSQNGLRGLERRLSCFIASGEDITGMLLVRKNETDELVIELIYAKEGCEKEDIPDMLRYFVRAAMIRYGKDQRIIFARVNE